MAELETAAGKASKALRQHQLPLEVRLRDDATTLKGWFKNPATRILLVFFFSNLGSAIGTFVAFGWLKDLF